MGKYRNRNNSSLGQTQGAPEQVIPREGCQFMCSVRAHWVRWPNLHTATNLFNKWANSLTPGCVQAEFIPWQLGFSMHCCKVQFENKRTTTWSPEQSQAEACMLKWMPPASKCPPCQTSNYQHVYEPEIHSQFPMLYLEEQWR